ncbi:MAG: hypothetical protein H5T50_07045 [Nitrososphaeria archaeon]|nr:hypothetical protein [Nitrososphaeria archaeon]
MKIMKKWFSTFLIALLFTVAFIPLIPTISAVEVGEPGTKTVDLIAGQHMDVGNIIVWIDGGILHVKYETIEGWYLIETHLAVATNLNGIPQTKTKNPIPGKFPYGRYYSPPVTADEYEIEGTFSGTLYIAAHAKVCKGEVVTEVYESGEGSAQVYGPISSYLPLNDAGWGTSKPAVETWKHPYWPLIPDSSAVWISSSYFIEDAQPDSWRKFTLTFDVLGVPLAGSIVTANSDNAEEVWLNGELIGSDGTVNVSFDASGGDPHEWNTLKDYPFTPVQGTNTLEFIVHNYAYPTHDPTVNPTGLIYKVTVSYLKSMGCETAWGEGDRFLGANWAMYFTYTV